MELDKAEKLARKLMKEHGLSEWIFRFDNAVVRFGLCSHRKKQISLSKELVLINKRKEIKNTILHEIAHALVGRGNGHNWVWKQKALEIGCNGERCYSSERVKPVIGKLSAKCDVCSRVVYRHTKPRKRLHCSIKCLAKSYSGSFLYFTKVKHTSQIKFHQTEKQHTMKVSFPVKLDAE